MMIRFETTSSKTSWSVAAGQDFIQIQEAYLNIGSIGSLIIGHAAIAIRGSEYMWKAEASDL